MILSVAHTLNSLRWTLPAALMVAPSPIFFSAIQILRIFKPVLPSKIFEECDEAFWSLFQRIVLFFFSNVNGAQVVFTGDYSSFLESKENALVLSNHQTAVDWIVMDMIGVQKNVMGRMRYMLKDELKYIPLFGLYFWQSWFVVFPEGTRYNPNKRHVIEKSRRFAENNDLPKLDYSLTPRCRGTYLTLTYLKSHVKVIYDITIGYESCRILSSKESWVRQSCPGMVDFLLSYSPKLHINIRKLNVADAPTDEDSLRQWMHQLFVRKESLMKTFIENGSFTSDAVHYQPVTRWHQTLPPTIFFLSITAAVLIHPVTRTAYFYTTVIGSLAGMIWMAFH